MFVLAKIKQKASILRDMFYSPKLFLRDYWVFCPILAIILCQIFIWGYLIYYIHPSDQQLFLHYNIIFGVDLVGQWWKMYYLPVGGLLIMIFNYFTSFVFYDSEKMLGRFLSVATALLHIFLVIATVFIVGLNI